MKRRRDPVMDALALIGDLPTLPVVALEVAALLDDSSSTPKQITEVMKTDQALTSKVLKLVNSAHYSIPGGVSSVERAIAFLGYNTIFQLLIGVSVLEFSRLGGSSGIDIRDFWKHSLGVAVASETIGKRISYNKTEELFAAGLLHDLGKLALAKVAKKKFSQAVDLAKKDGIILLNAEREIGLPTHDEVGSALAQQWRFPPGLHAVISSHHRSYLVRCQTVPNDQQSLLDVIVLANTLCKRFEIGDAGDSVIPEIDKDVMDRLGLVFNDVPQIKGEMTRKVEQSKAFSDLLSNDL
jgi:HD-like signal output (HDOD) protein